MHRQLNGTWARASCIVHTHGQQQRHRRILHGCAGLVRQERITAPSSQRQFRHINRRSKQPSTRTALNAPPKHLKLSGRLGFSPRAPTTDSFFARFTTRGRCELRQIFPWFVLDRCPAALYISTPAPASLSSQRRPRSQLLTLSLLDLRQSANPSALHHSLVAWKPSLCLRENTPSPTPSSST